MKEWFEVKVRARLGPDETDAKEIDVLGRKLVWTDSGIQYQADPKHRDIILEKFGLGPGSKGLKVTGKVEEQAEDGKELEPAEASEAAWQYDETGLVVTTDSAWAGGAPAES